MTCCISCRPSSLSATTVLSVAPNKIAPAGMGGSSTRLTPSCPNGSVDTPLKISAFWAPTAPTLEAKVTLLSPTSNSPWAVPPVAALGANSRTFTTPAVYPEKAFVATNRLTNPFRPFGAGAVITGAVVYPEPPFNITTLAVVEVTIS